MNRLIIIGASGHGKVVADITTLNRYEDIVFLDNDPTIFSCFGYPVLGPDTMTAELDGDGFVAVGNVKTRKYLMERDTGRNFPVLIHPSAVISKEVIIADGSVVVAGPALNPRARMGKGCIVNTSSSIDHDCILGDYCYVAVGVHLSRTVIVGEELWIGAGAIVSNNVTICDDCMIGAGSVVIKNIVESGTYVGVPVK